jgi:hypothetical protein
MNTRALRTTLAAVAIAASAIPALQSTASADAAIAIGQGVISPGVPTVPTACVPNATFDIDGTAVNLGTTFGPGPYTFHVHGISSTCASVLTDVGTATLSGDVTGTLTYSRTTGAISLNGNASVRGAASRPISINCLVVITSANPTTSFAVTCAVQI